MATLDDNPTFDFLRDTQPAEDQADFFQNCISYEDFPRDVLDFGIDPAFSTPSVLDAELQLPFGQQLLPSTSNFTATELNTNGSSMITPGLRNKFNILASAQAFKEPLWLGKVPLNRVRTPVPLLFPQ
ncbi:hypothetical protein H2198_007657 [Neophaeococcomyces mojaviensis]|uniref:Uncharacterized protein n=1 Tax=Neophaeococcomyces mojaviensis TaxID=3383035 RepID=A0ACC2ZZK1_9EURO|nr:hypothetical protein H2198_007657 [Knufia sp. JES_112]